MFKFPHLKDWDFPQPILPKDNLVASKWGTKGKTCRFNASYETHEEHPNMFRLISMEYSRMWFTEKGEWEKTQRKLSPAALKQLEWKQRDMERQKQIKLRRLMAKQKIKEQNALKVVDMTLKSTKISKKEAKMEKIGLEAVRLAETKSVGAGSSKVNADCRSIGIGSEEVCSLRSRADTVGSTCPVSPKNVSAKVTLLGQ